MVKKKYKNWRTFTPANEQVAENISLFTFCSHCESSIFFSLCEQTRFQMIGTLSKSWCCFSILHLSLSLPEASQSNIGLFEFGDNLFFPLFFFLWMNLGVDNRWIKEYSSRWESLFSNLLRPGSGKFGVKGIKFIAVKVEWLRVNYVRLCNWLILQLRSWQ